MGNPFSKRAGKGPGLVIGDEREPDKAVPDEREPDEFEIIGSLVVPQDAEPPKSSTSSAYDPDDIKDVIPDAPTTAKELIRLIEYRDKPKQAPEQFEPILDNPPPREETFKPEDAPVSLGKPKPFDKHEVKQVPVKKDADVPPLVGAPVPSHVSSDSNGSKSPDPVKIDGPDKVAESDKHPLTKPFPDFELQLEPKLEPEAKRSPTPFDKHAPAQQVLDDKTEPLRWSEYDPQPKLKDRLTCHEVRLGDHVAYFDPEDADKVEALMPFIVGGKLSPRAPLPGDQCGPGGLWRGNPGIGAGEVIKPSDKKNALVRLRMTLAINTGTPLSVMYQMEKVARLFHDALEPAGPDDTIAAKDLEACLESWVIEPTRYGPFPDLAAAVEYMCLPVKDGKIVGMALKHRFDPAPEPLVLSMKGETRVKSSNMSVLKDPVVRYARVSLWNEASRAIDSDPDTRKPLQIQH